jgi:hypothetical protein
MNRALLVLGANAANIKFPQHIEDLKVGSARIPKQSVNALGPQGLSQKLGTAQCPGPLFWLEIGQ